MATNGRAVCWSISTTVQCEIGASDDGASVAVTAPESVRALEMDPYALCALLASGSAYCWDLTEQGLPMRAGRRFGRDFVDLVLAHGDPCGVTRGGTISCDGRARETHEERPQGVRVVSIAEGPCVVTDDGRVFCRGPNVFGSVGPSCMERECDEWHAVPVPEPADAVVSALGGVCARARTGLTLYCWGGVPPGFSEDPEATVEPLEPGIREHQFLQRILQLRAGGGVVCAHLENREVHCLSFEGQRTLDGVGRSPELVVRDALQVAVGDSTVCTLGSDLAIRCGGAPPPYGGLVTSRGFPGETVVLPEDLH